MKDFTKSRIFSFKYAIRGLIYVLRTQRNAWIHLAATTLAILAGIIFKITRQDWLWIILAIAAVWTAEIINTALETLVDLVSPEINPLAKIIKDSAAAAVLILAAFSVVVAGLIFLPYLIP